MFPDRNSRAAVCAAILFTAGACASDSAATSEFCLIYEPVYVARRDTAETVRQIMRNNAAWEALCHDQSRISFMPTWLAANPIRS